MNNVQTAIQAIHSVTTNEGALGLAIRSSSLAEAECL